MPAPPLQWTAGGGTPGHARPAGAEKCFEHRLRSIIASPQRAARGTSAHDLLRDLAVYPPTRAPPGPGGLPRCSEGSEYRPAHVRAQRPDTAMRDRSGMMMLPIQTMRPASLPLSELRVRAPRPRLSPHRSAGALARTVCRSCCVCGLISGGHPLQAHPRLPSFAMQANHAR